MLAPMAPWLSGMALSAKFSNDDIRTIWNMFFRMPVHVHGILALQNHVRSFWLHNYSSASEEIPFGLHGDSREPSVAKLRSMALNCHSDCLCGA